MNNGMKKGLAVLVTAMTMTTGAAAYASPDVPPPTQPHSGIIMNSPVAAQQSMVITVNGVSLTENGYQGGETAMLPLRAVTEALGFSLTWKQEDLSVDLTKGNLFTNVKAGEDRYAINKMYKSLGTAPVLLDNKLYVPSSFVGEVLHGTVATDGNSVTITQSEQKKTVLAKGVITSINEQGKFKSVHINGVGTEGLVLNVGDETVIQSADGKSLSFGDLALGQEIEVEHSMAMTMSLPPQTAAYKITVLDGLGQKDLIGTAGAIEEVITNDKGEKSLRIKGEGLTEQSPDEVVLRLTDKTVVTDNDGNAVDPAKLTKGAKVIGYYTPALTKSLPPIGTAWKIVLEPTPAE